MNEDFHDSHKYSFNPVFAAAVCKVALAINRSRSR